jgi:non-specific serine/threonine protein kinase
MAGEYEEAERLHEVSLAAFRRLGDDRGAATVLQRLAMDAMARGDVERAQVCVDESLRLYRSKLAEALALRTYGFIEWQAGNHERAVELFEQSAALAGEAGQTWLQASFLLHRAELLLEQGRLGESESASREALRLATRIGARQATIIAVSLLAQVEGEAGQPERAGRLWGAIEAEEARGPVGQWDVEREEAARPVLAHAGPEFERGRQEGRHLSLQEAADEVLQAERIVT